MIPLIDLKKQYETIADELEKNILDCLRSGHYIMGPQVERFEASIKEYHDIKHAITCANGTDALILSLQACDIGQGDEVITSPFTFFATAEAISRVGAKPVFVDVFRDTYNIDVSKIENSITEKTKAIIPVHIFGQPAEMDEIMRISEKYDLYVIEDACQAIGAEYKSRKAGTIGDIGCFSFFPTKNLGAFGDGGMIITNDDNLAKIIKALRTHGSGKSGLEAFGLINGIPIDESFDTTKNSAVYDKTKYYNYLVGYNSRLDEIQAATLTVKLKYIDAWNKKRNENAYMYNIELDKTDLVLPVVREGILSAFHLYVVQSEDREGLCNYLKLKGVSTGIYYPVPLHLQKVYVNLGYKCGDLPNAEYLSERTFAIPVYPELTDEEKHYIISNIKEFKG